MNSPLRRLTATAIALAAIGVAGLAAMGNVPIAEPAVLAAALWLLLLGWGFRFLLGRHLQFKDRLAFAETQLGMEHQARTLAERALADQHTALCRLIQQQERVRETERNRIARDIHDDLGQHLLALKIELSLAHASTSGAHPPIHEKLGGMLHSLELTIKSLRVIINNLRPLALEQGLRHAIETQLAEFSRINGIRHALEVEPGAFDASRHLDVDAMLFRILQESLANVARHAQATEVKVAFVRRDGLLTLKVQDNGIGMVGQGESQGCGLVGIADRVAAAGGKFVIDSQPGAGTALSLTIPVAGPVPAL